MTTGAKDHRRAFLELARAAAHAGTLVKLTLGKYRGADATLENLFLRPVILNSGAQLTLVWRHKTRDITKNLPLDETLALLDSLVGRDFLDAHLFTPEQNAQLECAPDGSARLRLKKLAAPASGTARSSIPATHDRTKTHLIPADAPCLRSLGVTNDRGQAREGMADKFRQIQKFAELLSHLIAETELPTDRPLQIVDMGSGKGYLTFAIATLLGERAQIQGVEARAELVELCNRAARQHGMDRHLSFSAGTIDDTALERCDVLIALHACDTATDDALAKGVAANAALLVVSPCCQKELRPQLHAPPVLADALKHGIFQERQAEFVTDALRAQLLEWAGYRTKVFEFISTEHTAKNLMIAAIKSHAPGDAGRARSVRELAAFYGVRSQKLATQLHFPLTSP